MTHFDANRPTEPRNDGREIQADALGSVALARLVDEVKNAGDSPLGNPTAYNRTYHRHNR